MAKKDDIEKEILEEAQAEVKAEAKPKKEKKKASLKKKEKSGLLGTAKAQLDELKAAKKDDKKIKKPTISRIYTVNLRSTVSRPKKSRKAVSDLRIFAAKHMKSANRIAISPEVSETIYSRGVQKPPAKLRIKIDQDEDGVATVKLK